MKQYLSKLLSSLLLAVVVLNIGVDQQSTYAESQKLSFTETTVVLMPEYNKHPDKDINEPNLLVGFHGTLINQRQEPISEITIPVPTKEVNFALSLVASNSESEEVNEIKHAIDQKNETVTLNFEEPIAPGASKKIMIEYFYTPISIAEGKKSFSYDFKAFADADTMNMILFEPYYAETFSAIPQSDKQATDSMGVKMHLYQYENIKQSETKHYEFSYIKEDDLTTIEIVEQITSENLETASADEGQASAEQTSNTNQGFFGADVIFAIVLIVLILIGFAFWIMGKRKRIAMPKEIARVSSKAKLNKKELRKMLADGEINEDQYMKEISKLG